MSRSLVVLPDDSARPMLDAINQATRSLRIKMFVFSDPAILQTVIAAHKRGVDVRVMLNPARRSGESENEESRKLLSSSGVNVLDSNPAFDLTHEKSMVVDDAGRVRDVVQLGAPKPDGDARLRGRHHCATRSGGDHGVFRRRLEPQAVHPRRPLAPDLVRGQRAPAHRAVH